MPVYLGDYRGSASGREEKFIRAVNSFMDQSYSNKELIIVSDACHIASKIYHEMFDNKGVVLIVYDKKQPLFSGSLRSEGIRSSTGDIITYLDSDDELGENHLESLANCTDWDNVDWVYFNDYLSLGNGQDELRIVEMKHGKIGTSNIAHHSRLKANWDGCDGYGHDWMFIKKLQEISTNYKKVFGMNYIVHHIPNLIDN